MTQRQITIRLAGYLKNTIFSIIVFVPFYAFFSTWIASYAGGLLYLRGMKDLLLIVCVILACFIVIKDKKLLNFLKNDRLIQVAAVFGVWLFVVTATQLGDIDAQLLGLLIQLRGVLFFVVALITARYVLIKEGALVRLVTIPAIGVIVFGLLQMFALPHDFLKHFGYDKYRSIPPFFTIDDQIEKIRIASTLRGPNPLGVYLIAPIMLTAKRAAALFRNRKRPMLTACYLLLSITVLYGSHSRSSWLGLLAASVAYLWFLLAKKWKLIFVVIVAAASVIAGGVIYQQRDSEFVQDVILHDNDETGGEISSNQGRIESFKAALGDMKERPLLGCGVGCAGPASFHNEAGAKISENYYLQTVQEAGFIGLALLLLLHALVASRLLSVKANMARLWLAVFVGVSVASMLSHAWVDDTITYVWWGIAGLLIGSSSNVDPGTASAPRPHTSA